MVGASFIDSEEALAIRDAAVDDYESAKLARQDLEERKLEDYETYRAYRRDVSGDGGKKDDDRGPFGWSKMVTPLAFWTVETTVPRYASAVPTVITNPINERAIPFRVAKRLRLQRQLELADPLPAVHLALKERAILGDGPVKVTWDPARHRCQVTSIGWWNFWMSSEAQDYRTAECLFHMTWHTKRQLQRLARVKGPDGEPVFHNLEAIWDSGSERSVQDTQYADRRSVAGMSTTVGDRRGRDIPLLECWYDDGTRVILGGDGLMTLVHAQLGPYRDCHGEPLRPFVVFQGIADLHMPYAISDVEMIKSQQAEITTIRNQNVDQMTANLNAPIAFDRRIGAGNVRRAFSEPGSLLPVDGDPTRAVMRVAPGQVSQDPVALTQMVLEEVQRVTGMSDIGLGQLSGLGQTNTTATGAQLAVQQGNVRWSFQQNAVQRALQELVGIIDAMDRTFMVLDVPVPLEGSGEVTPEGEGMIVHDGVAVVSPAVNGWTMRDGEFHLDPYDVGPQYDVKLKDGSQAPPTPRDRQQSIIGFLGTMAQSPQLAARLDWSYIAREACEAFGFQVEHAMATPGEVIAPDQQPGEVPVGDPVPLSPEEEAQMQPGSSETAGPPPAVPPGEPAAAGDSAAGMVPPDAALAAGAGAPPGEPQPPAIVIAPGAINVTPEVTVNVGAGQKQVIRDEQGRPQYVDTTHTVDTGDGAPYDEVQRQPVEYDHFGQIAGLGQPLGAEEPPDPVTASMEGTL